jgi:thioesterase domain-containing protein/acyl carrier protein
MIPASFIQIDEIPLNVVGKIDAGKLPQPKAEYSVGNQPSSPTELALVELIKPLVPVKTLYMENSFFELGGDSLKALRLITAINRHFGTQITPAVLFHEPTLAQLAAHIERGAPSSSPLVALNPFGTRTPLVCVPGENGQAMHFSQLSSALGEDYPLYAVQHPRYDPRTPVFKTFEALAGHYVKLTRDALRGDPEFLVGASVGGIIAYEMAQQIAAAGSQPPVVIMVDSHFNIPGRPRAWDEYTQQQRRQQRLNDPPLLTLRKWIHRLRRDLAKRFPSDPNERATRRVKVETRRIAKPYVAKPYIGKVIYLTCREDRHRNGHIERNDHLRWQEMAQGGFELIDVPGNHLSVLEMPDVRTSAEHFRRILAAP